MTDHNLITIVGLIAMPFTFLNAALAAKRWAQGEALWAGCYAAGFAFAVMGYAKWFFAP